MNVLTVPQLGTLILVQGDGQMLPVQSVVAAQPGGKVLVADVDAQATFAFSPAANFAAVRAIPSPGGTTLQLPAAPAKGDVYQFQNEDGSCSSSSPIKLSPLGGKTVNGASLLTFHAAGSWAIAIYNDVTNDWCVLSPNAATAPGPLTSRDAWTETAFWVNPATGSNNNNGTTQGSPLADFSELVRRYGTLSPALSTATITFDGGDHPGEVALAPLLAGGGQVIIQATLPAPTTAGVVLSSVTALNRSAGTFLQANLGSTAAANMLVINRTRANSRAFVKSHVSGNVWILSQPLSPVSFPFGAVPTEATWQSGDTVDLYVLRKVNVVDLAAVEDNTTFPGLCVYQLDVWDQAGGGANPVQIGPNVSFFECVLERYGVWDATGGVSYVVNCANSGGAAGGSQNSTIQMWGGFLTDNVSFQSELTNWFFDLDAIIGQAGGSDFKLHGDLSTLGIVGLSASLHCYGRVGATGSLLGASIIYGASAIVKNVGEFIYATAQTASGTFLNGQLTLNNATTAYSANTAQPTVIEGGITLSPTTLDNAQGTTGFGGSAFQLGGGWFRKADAF